MIRPLLLDTCALLFIFNGSKIAPSAEAAFREAQQASGGILASPISAWELGLLVSRGRISLPLDPHAWFEAALEEGVRLAPMPASVLVSASFLPESPLRDPADRIMAATARAFGYRLMTRDRPLLEYGAAGHLTALPC